MTLRQTIKEILTMQGYMKKDLHDRLSVSFQTVSRWQSGKNKPEITTIGASGTIVDTLIRDGPIIAVLSAGNPFCPLRIACDFKLQRFLRRHPYE